jgi:hypothetical protein
MSEWYSCKPSVIESYLYKLINLEFNNLLIWKGINDYNIIQKKEIKLIAFQHPKCTKNEKTVLQYRGYGGNINLITGIRADNSETVKVSFKIGSFYILRSVTVQRLNKFIENMCGFILKSGHDCSFEFEDSISQKYYLIGYHYDSYRSSDSDFSLWDKLEDNFIYPIVPELRVFMYTNGIFTENYLSSMQLRQIRNAVRTIENYVLPWLYRTNGSMYAKSKLHFETNRNKY